MANIAIVNTKITTLNTHQVLTQSAADENGANTAQTFVYTPTGRDNKICFLVYTAVAFAMTYSIAAGVGVFGAAAKTGTFRATAGLDALQIETGKYMLANGTITITLTPASGKALLGDHAATIAAIELQ